MTVDEWVEANRRPPFSLDTHRFLAELVATSRNDTEDAA